MTNVRRTEIMRILGVAAIDQLVAANCRSNNDRPCIRKYSVIAGRGIVLYAYTLIIYGRLIPRRYFIMNFCDADNNDMGYRSYWLCICGI